MVRGHPIIAVCLNLLGSFMAQSLSCPFSEWGLRHPGGRAPSLQSSDRSFPPPLSSLVILSVADRVLESPAVLAVFPFPFRSVGFASCILRLCCSVQSLSCVPLFSAPWIVARQASLSITDSWSLLKTYVQVGDAIQSSHLLSSPFSSCPPIPPSIRVFSSESVLLIRWPEYWSFSFSISPSNEYSGLISFRMVGSPCSPRDS